jgi:hypothetical protein
MNIYNTTSRIVKEYPVRKSIQMPLSLNIGQAYVILIPKAYNLWPPGHTARRITCRILENKYLKITCIVYFSPHIFQKY